jgi:pyruvate ferredoxin oxidoreductase delta subunit
MTTKPDIKGWRDLNPGGVVESGTSEWFHTGDWRSKAPIWQEKNCIQCMMCWAVCPDNAVKVRGKAEQKDPKREVERGEHDYAFCKGCGLCAEECPKATTAINEVKKADPGAVIDAWDGAANPTFVQKAAICMVSIKEAREKHGIK